MKIIGAGFLIEVIEGRCFITIPNYAQLRVEETVKGLGTTTKVLELKLEPKTK